MTKPISNDDIAKLLNELASVLEALGDNPFKIRAYKNAAETVEFLDESLVSIWERGQLEQVNGIGRAIAEKLGEIFEHGQSQEVEEIKSRVPAAMFTLLPLEGIGPKKAYRLTTEFNLTNPQTVLDDILELIKADQIAQLEGFGQKSQQVIKNAIENYTPENEQRMRLDQADSIADELIAYLNKSQTIKDISALGSLRRRKSTIGDIDLGITSTDPERTIEYIKAFPKIGRIITAGEEMVRITHTSGANVDVKILDPAMWGALLQHFTGSKQHNVALRERALSKGLSLSEHGIKQVDRPQASLSDKQKAAQQLQTYSREEDFYQALGLDWIPPEMREHSGEIDQAEKGQLPHLVELNDIKGEFHTHTNYDWPSSHDYGTASVEDVIQKAIQLNYAYIGIGDHNPSSTAGDATQINKLVQKRIQYINNIAAKYKSTIKVLNTLEVDIKPDGSLALDPESCKLFDVIIVSIHSNLTMDKKRMTKRLLKALDNPKVKIIGHPTGRLIKRRKGFELDWPEIFAVCKSKQIALEINANPNRLDINEYLVRQAINQKVKLVINTDAHKLEHLDYIKYGIDVARRGWAEPKHIVNTQSTKQLLKWVAI